MITFQFLTKQICYLQFAPKISFFLGKSAILTQAKTPFKACFTGQKEET